jgi:hypothetical protein
MEERDLLGGHGEQIELGDFNGGNRHNASMEEQLSEPKG